MQLGQKIYCLRVKSLLGTKQRCWKERLGSQSVTTWGWACRQEVAAGEAAAARGRAGVEAKLGALTDRLLHMARKEAKREKRRGAPFPHDPQFLLF